MPKPWSAVNTLVRDSIISRFWSNWEEEKSENPRQREREIARFGVLEEDPRQEVVWFQNFPARGQRYSQAKHESTYVFRQREALVQPVSMPTWTLNVLLPPLPQPRLL